MKLDVIIEESNKMFWGRVDGFDFLPVTVGSNMPEVIENLIILIIDYIENEGK